MHIEINRLLFTFILFAGISAHAKPTLQPIAPEKIDLTSFIKQGAITGGSAKSENVGPLSLLQVRKVAPSKTSERLTLKFGDKNGAVLSEPGFFNIALDEGGTRLVVDLAQVQQTSVDQDDLRAMFKQSNLVRDVEITMDPVDKSTNLTFRMKRPVMAKASKQAVEDGSLNIDIQDLN